MAVINKKFKIVLINIVTENLEEILFESLTFPEAVNHAYSAKNLLGHEWRIKSVEEILTRDKPKKK